LIHSATTPPEGLTEYYNHSDWPAAWFCATKLSEGYNYGSYMRWNAAVVEMDRYFKTPVLYRNMGIEMFCNFVEESIHEAAFTTYLAMKLRPRATTVKEFGLEISALFSHFYPFLTNH
jgi:hypothetical protein